MIIVHSGDVKGLVTPDPHHRELKVLLSPLLEQEVQGLSVGMTILPPGNSTSNHAHESEVEAWLVVQGTGKAVVDGESADVGPETVIFVPPKAEHQLINNGRTELRMFWVYAPPGAEKAVLEGLQK
jgi:mannose-6-phosphate isomerase-like protein (cupin superfamily)